LLLADTTHRRNSKGLLTINIINNIFLFLYMLNEFNDSLKKNYQLNKLQIKSSLFKGEARMLHQDILYFHRMN
jgi:hypothetical protein